MLRKLLAAVLALALAAPAVVQAKSPCGMDTPVLGAAPCDCCDSPASADAVPCGSASAADAGCGCSIQRDSAERRAAAPSATTPSDAPVADLVLLPADFTAPRRTPRSPRFAAPPPRTTASRSQLCIWTI
jgi:hypothetical protein